ncbi:UPF0489 family protein [Steroidobacter sp. S1-65]|uniref:UPF0489 family protein n=1 Tax=Steroidobacter gossypii TaxID=2805490 RepID=A0ABS1WXX6_9GAMM|nr:UPF0489 family protein [Steroidobacter gossypii]MBM0105830.1 UPF0489 family protein [Steroidobacter gossypii]
MLLQLWLTRFDRGELHIEYPIGMTHTKPLYITESHHHVLTGWARLRRDLVQAPRLLTLDYHTDTKPAYFGYATDNQKPDRPWRDIADEHVAALDFRNECAVTTAISKLRYDEHIDAAIRAGILDLAFVAAHQDGGHIQSNEQIALDAKREKTFVTPQGEEITVLLPRREIAPPPFTYSLPQSRIVILPKTALDSALKGDERDRAYRDSAIETDSLDQRLALIDEIVTSVAAPGLFDQPFILDIDLDYFNTRKSIAPRDTSTFYRLIRQAAIITIARESTCVATCQIEEGEGLDSDFLESALLEHISRALSSAGQSPDVVRLA